MAYLQQVSNLQAPLSNPAGLHSQEYQDQYIPYSGGTLCGTRVQGPGPPYTLGRRYAPTAQGPWQPRFQSELGLVFWTNIVTTEYCFYPPTPILESYLEDKSDDEEFEEPAGEPPPESEESEQEIIVGRTPERIQIDPTEDFPLLRNPLTEATTPDTNTPVPAHTTSLLFQTPLVTTSQALVRQTEPEKKDSPDSDKDPLGSLPPLLQNIAVPTFAGLPLALLQNQNIVANILHFALPQPPAPPAPPVPPAMAAAAAGPITAADLQAGLNKLKGNSLIFYGRPGEHPLAFKNRIGMLIHTKGLTDDDDKLQEWLNHLGRRAATWANAFYDDLLNPPAGPGGQGVARRYTYQNFLDEFNQTYAFENLQNNSRKQLDNLRQGKKSVAQYIQQFQTLSHLAGYGEADTLQRFLTGLDEKIRYDLMLMGHDNTLERAMAQSQQLELIRAGNRDAYQDPGRTSNTPQVDPNPYGYAPMDLDATKTPTKPTTQCYRCRKYGHIARNCKAPGNFRGRGRGHGRGGMLYVPPGGFRGRATNELQPEDDRMQGVEQELTAQ